MTLTAPGCGMGEVLVRDVREKLEAIPTVSRGRAAGVRSAVEPVHDVRSRTTPDGHDVTAGSAPDDAAAARGGTRRPAAGSAGNFASVEINGRFVAVFNVDGEFLAVDDVCTHDGEGLAGGELDGDVVVRPRHGADSACAREKR